METDTIHQTIFFNAEPLAVYNMMMDQKLHSAFTGSPVEMSTEIEGAFSVFDGYCRGYNIELIEGEKIVQAWNFLEDGWPEEHYSNCTFIFSKTPEGCRLDFTQTGIPPHKVTALSEGWEEFYWKLIREYLDNK